MVGSTITLWEGHVAATEADYKHFWLLLDKAEQEHANSFKNPQLRLRYVEVHARLRILLGDIVNSEPNQLRIHKAEFGKPYLADYPDLQFNLSHTANKMVVAVAWRFELGVDIEVCKPRANLAALVEKCFAEEEKNYWKKLPESKQMCAFYRFWTRKEAFVKATGRGIAIGLQHCVINPNKPTQLLSIPLGYGSASEWSIHQIDLDSVISGALVVKSPDVSHVEVMNLV